MPETEPPRRHWFTEGEPARRGEKKKNKGRDRREETDKRKG